MDAAYNIINHRRELCQTCRTPCEYQKNVAFRTNGDNVCPIGRWKAYELYSKPMVRGLGDAVAMIANPLAAVADKVFKTKIKGCSACAKRREALNALMPFNYKL